MLTMGEVDVGDGVGEFVALGSVLEPVEQPLAATSAHPIPAKIQLLRFITPQP